MSETCAVCGEECPLVEPWHMGGAPGEYEEAMAGHWRRGYEREKARADAAEVERDGLLDLQRKARATVAAMYETVREAELRPPLATYVEMRREGSGAPLQYYAMKPEKVTGFYEALRDRWNGTDVERWAKEFIEARDRIAPLESALAAARRECEGLRAALTKIRDECSFMLNRDIPWVRHVAAEALAAPAAAAGEEKPNG